MTSNGTTYQEFNWTTIISTRKKQIYTNRRENSAGKKKKIRSHFMINSDKSGKILAV